VNGFQQLCTNRMANAKILRDAIKAMTYKGKPRFTMLDSGDSGCLPVVTACFNQDFFFGVHDGLNHTSAACFMPKWCRSEILTQQPKSCKCSSRRMLC